MIRSFLLFLVLLGIFAGLWWAGSLLSHRFFSQDEEKGGGASIVELPEKTREVLAQLEQEEQKQHNGGEENKRSQPESASQESTSSQEDFSLSVLVLNGGAERGAAGKARDLLKKHGYVQVQAANASSYTHRGVKVYYSGKGTKETAEALAAFLEKKGYNDPQVLEAATSEQKKASLVVLLGEQ